MIHTLIMDSKKIATKKYCTTSVAMSHVSVKDMNEHVEQLEN